MGRIRLEENTVWDEKSVLLYILGKTGYWKNHFLRKSQCAKTRLYAPRTKKRLKQKLLKPFFLLVRQAGFEPATYGLEVRCSIQLSYWRM